MKGIIIEKSIFHTLILTPTGEYKKINRVIKREIGEEIELENRRFALKHVIAVAAMFMLFVFSSLYYDMRFNKEVFAFVTVDINPSIEFEINQHNYVISATAFNDDAKKVLENMSYRFRKIDEVASRFTKKAVELQFLDGVNDHIFLSVISNNGMGDNDLTVMIERIVNVQSATLEEENIEAFVGVLQLTIESRNLAREYGVSATTLELSKEITGVNKQGVVIINLEELEDMSDEALDRIIDTINKRCENKDADFGDSEENEEDDDKKGEEDEDGDDDDQDENEEKDDDDDQDENEEKDDDDDQDENEEQEDGDDQDENEEQEDGDDQDENEEQDENGDNDQDENEEQDEDEDDGNDQDEDEEKDDDDDDDDDDDQGDNEEQDENEEQDKDGYEQDEDEEQDDDDDDEQDDNEEQEESGDDQDENEEQEEDDDDDEQDEEA